MAEVVSLHKATPPPSRFFIGDCVKLKGGRVLMTIRSATKTKATVDWHDAADDLQSAEFPCAMLEITERDPEPESVDE